MPTLTDFTWVEGAEPHRQRTRDIIKKHPEVKFEGLRPRKVAVRDDLHPIKRNKPGVKTKIFTGDKGHHPTHAGAGQVSPGMGNAALKMLSEADEDADTDSYMFYEIADESYTLKDDYEMNSDEDMRVLRNSEGSNEIDDVKDIQPPQNIMVEDIAVVPQTESTDGVPTYMASIIFDDAELGDEYEIRIVKKQ